VTPLSDAARAHIDALARAWLGLPAGRDVPTMPERLARRLLRAEEYEQSHRDQWGNWEFAFCDAYREGRLWEPDLDRWLLEVGGPEPLWPDGHPFAICLSHDVDLVSEAVTPRQALRSMRLSVLGSGAVRLARPPVRAVRAVAHGISRTPSAEALERCVELEHAHGVTATYFFTVYPGSEGHRYDCTYDFDDPCLFGGERLTVAEVVQTIDREGFEVGLHGSYNSALIKERQAHEKHALELATGLAVTSVRQHFLHWDARTTPRIQSRAGLSADSTLGFNRNIGLRAGTSLPFRWFDVQRDEALDLVELPMLVGDVALLRADALELGLELAWKTLEAVIDRIASVGGVATLVFHPNNLEESDHAELFRRTIGHGKERNAWFASVRDLDAWFRTREE
jgi:hypothetical protein